MPVTFNDLGVSADISSRLAEDGVIEPFPIQEATIPVALTGRDVCGRAPTGSGKTLAFGIPLVTRVSKAKPGRPRALVLAPTRELAPRSNGSSLPWPPPGSAASPPSTAVSDSAASWPPSAAAPTSSSPPPAAWPT